MAKVDAEELYPLFYALHRHVQGTATIAGIKVDDELSDAITRFARIHDNRPVAPEKQVTPERVKAILKGMKHQPDIRLAVVEDGPNAKRPKTAQEMAAERQEAEDEADRLFRKFLISASYGICALILGFSLFIAYATRDIEQREVTGPTIEGEQVRSLHPLEIGGLVCIAIASWGIAEAIIIAKNHWADFDRVKEAVPVVGKAWARRTRRKRREREKQVAEKGA
ncbi:MAG: hypothetical protein KDC38_04575 [Planctomycetes bacterium]|nr:hypothetical protein [Planctomycetota bacterium]